MKKFKSFLKTLIAPSLGILFGAVMMALILDNRIGAMIKAFQHPQIVNSSQFAAEITAKK